MAKMKDSGIKYVGTIPENWTTVPISSVCDEVTHKNINGEVTHALKFTYGEIVPKQDFDADNDDYVATTILGYTIVNPKTIMVNGLNLNFDFVSQRVAQVKEHGIITSAYIAFAPKSNDAIDSDYLTYQLKCWDAQKAFHNMGAGVRKILNFNELKKKHVVYPDIETQRKIVAYLNAACSKIDSVSADIQEQIRVLEDYRKSVISEAVTKGLDKNVPMKHTGIFYAPDINENWFITKLGYICTKMSRTFDEDATALICSNKGKVMIRPETMVGIMVSEDHAMQGIRQGDIAIHGMDTWHGAIALSEYDGKITRVVHVCQTDEDARFIVYYLQHLAYIGVYKLISYGVRENTSDFRSWEKTKDIYVPLPKTIEEQRVICDYLDSQIKRIDSMIALKQEQLDILNKYKQSIIYEYVTGKKEVV